METRIIIHLVDGKKTENGYEFSDYSEPRKPQNGSMYDFMASTYTGEYITWYEGKTLVETILEHLKDYYSFMGDDDAFAIPGYKPETNRWEYDEKNKVFYAVWLENGEPTGDVFKIASVRKVCEGQSFADGEPVEF